MAKPIMAKATAVWLVDNTTISFKQIADFVGMHELEVQGIADGDVAGVAIVSRRAERHHLGLSAGETDQAVCEAVLRVPALL